MGLGGSIARSIGRKVARDIERWEYTRSTYGRLQTQTAALPGSRQVRTPVGTMWMSAIEAQLYEAMCADGLDPIPQYYIQGYYADFAFPDVQMVVEADGAAHKDADRRERDRKRDWILRRQGWTVKRFHGTTIYHRAANCSFVVKREVEARRLQIALEARERERRRQARREVILRPFQVLRRLILGARGRANTQKTSHGAPPKPPDR